MKKAFILLAGLFFIATPVFAATFTAGDLVEQKDDVVNDDAYIAGASVDVTGNVGGDAILAGGDVSLLGDVQSDVNAAAGTLNMVGRVGDDARVAAGEISIASSVGDDLVAAGGFIKVLSDAQVGGDAVFAGGAVVVNGTISGDLTVYGEEVVIDGPVNGNVNLRFTKKVTLGEDAAIGGNFTYSAVEDIEIPEGVVIGGEVTRTESPMRSVDKDALKKVFGVLLFGKFLVMLVTALVLVLVFKNLSASIGSRTVTSFWRNALYGFIGLVVTPFAVIILFTTLLGSYLGVLTLGAYLFLLFVMKAYVGISVGALLSKWTKKKAIVNWKWALLGVVVAQVVGLVPIVGHITLFLVAMATLGSIGVIIHDKVWLKR